jgi:hypothetical protein
MYGVSCRAATAGPRVLIISYPILVGNYSMSQSTLNSSVSPASMANSVSNPEIDLIEMIGMV